MTAHESTIMRLRGETLELARRVRALVPADLSPDTRREVDAMLEDVDSLLYEGADPSPAERARLAVRIVHATAVLSEVAARLRSAERGR